MSFSQEVLYDILHAVAELRIPRVDGVILDALKVPDEILKEGGVRCRYYKRMIERDILNHPAIKPVSVHWTAHGECFLRKAV